MGLSSEEHGGRYNTRLQFHSCGLHVLKFVGALYHLYMVGGPQFLIELHYLK